MAKQDQTILIVLDYLLNHTDEAHPTRAEEIITYASENYGVQIDRRSIKSFLEKLKDLNDLYPDKFPFILEKNDLKRPKYYLEQKYLSEEDILAIACAIKDSFQIDENTSKELILKFVEVTTNVYQKQKILDIVNNQPEKSAKISPTTANMVKRIEKAISEKRMITYQHKYSTNSEINTNYFYKIMYLGNEPFAVIIRDGKLFSMLVKNIKIIRVEESWYDDPRCRFQIKDEYNGAFASPDEEIKQNIVPNSVDPYLATLFFSFPNSAYAKDTILNSFSSFLHIPLKYKEEGDHCLAKVHTKIDIILSWITQYQIANLIHIKGDTTILSNLETHYKRLIHTNNLNHYNFIWKDSAKINKKK